MRDQIERKGVLVWSKSKGVDPKIKGDKNENVKVNIKMH